MQISYTKGAIAATAFALLGGTAAAQGWSDNFDSYPNGAAVDPGGLASIGNNWESWSSGIGSSTVAGSPPAPAAFSAPNSLANNNGCDTVANLNNQASLPTSGKWIVDAKVYHTNAFTDKTYFIMLSNYQFAGPYHWAVQAFFDGTTNAVDCDCNNMNTGTVVLQRDAWVDWRVEIDLDLDTVDVFYDNVSLTGGVGYTWTGGVFGGGGGFLAIEAFDLYPSTNLGGPMYYDDLNLHPETGPQGTNDPVCITLPNSTGFPAVAAMSGTGVAGDDLTAIVTQGPPSAFGYFISGPNPGLYITPPGSNGIICIGGPQYRYNNVGLGDVFQFDAGGQSHPVGSGGVGDVVLATDGTTPGVPAVLVNETRAFQAWYRDGAASNFSNSVIITFN